MSLSYGHDTRGPRLPIAPDRRSEDQDEEGKVLVRTEYLALCGQCWYAPSTRDMLVQFPAWCLRQAFDTPKSPKRGRPLASWL